MAESSRSWNEFEAISVTSGDVKEKLDFHLQLAKKCVEEVHGLPTQKFNNEQCSYLVSKLEVAVEAASLFLEWSQVQPRGPYITMHIAKQAKNLELLVALANEIESFVQSCSKDTWMESALTLAHAAKHVSSLGFNLELCKIAFDCGQTKPRSLTIDEVCKINKDEVEIVVKKASRDKDILLKNVTFELNSSDFKDCSLAKHLVHQLVEVQPKPTSDDDNVILRLFEWVVSGKKAKQLGRGSSASVHEVKWFGIPAAKKTFIGSENEDFFKEVEILSQLRHPNITSMFCCHMNKWSCSIIMELMDGDLRNMMLERQSERKNDAPPFTILEGVDIMLQVGEGVNYLHDKRIVHRDLKSSNILVKFVEVSGLGLGYVQAKVVDFGLSRTKEKSTYSVMTYNTGTQRWMAPEVINIIKCHEESFEASEKLEKYVFKVDIYSFAMVCFEILTGEIPFISAPSLKRIKEMILEGERPRIPDYCPRILKSLIEKCWSQIPSDRPCISDICLQLKYIKYLLMTDSNSVDACKSMVTNIVPTKVDCGPHEIFVVHQLHPQVGDISTSVRATLIFFYGFHEGLEEWRRTWMTLDNKLVWPQEWLPEDLGAEYLRVLCVSFGENTTMNNLQEMGKNLVNSILLSPEWKLGESGEAIFLIGHSFGGVLIKNLVIEARHVVQNNRGQQEAKKCEKFLERLGKIVFYIVPHDETDNYISEFKKFLAIRESSFLASVEGDAQFFADMNKLSVEFENAIPEKLQILAFLEGKAMRKEFSARPPPALMERNPPLHTSSDSFDERSLSEAPQVYRKSTTFGARSHDASEPFPPRSDSKSQEFSERVSSSRIADSYEYHEASNGMKSSVSLQANISGEASRSQRRVDSSEFSPGSSGVKGREPLQANNISGEASPSQRSGSSRHEASELSPAYKSSNVSSEHTYKSSSTSEMSSEEFSGSGPVRDGVPELHRSATTATEPAVGHTPRAESVRSASCPRLSESIIEDVVKKYTWDDVLDMTNDLKSRQFGQGGFGAVFLGKLENGKEVAVKILDVSSQQGINEFLNEVNLLKRINHVNLIRLLGYCQDEVEALIYEFAEEGSIWDHLQAGGTSLNWKQRLNIALQSANGLEYLHTGCSPRIIHRGIKSQNILLTKSMVAKVADFGLSKLGADQENLNITHMTTTVKGTLGYLDPEYLKTGQWTEKSDVYSFGVILLEIITGRKPIEDSDKKRFIGDWVEDHYNGRALKTVADPNLGGQYNPKALKRVIKVAKLCTLPYGADRPDMTQVVSALREAQAAESLQNSHWNK